VAFLLSGGGAALLGRSSRGKPRQAGRPAVRPAWRAAYFGGQRYSVSAVQRAPCPSGRRARRRPLGVAAGTERRALHRADEAGCDCSVCRGPGIAPHCSALAFLGSPPEEPAADRSSRPPVAQKAAAFGEVRRQHAATLAHEAQRLPRQTQATAHRHATRPSCPGWACGGQR